MHDVKLLSSISKRFSFYLKLNFFTFLVFSMLHAYLKIKLISVLPKLACLLAVLSKIKCE